MVAPSGTETTTYRVTITRSGADGATTQTARELGITALERCTTPGFGLPTEIAAQSNQVQSVVDF